MRWWDGDAGAHRLARDEAMVSKVQPALRHSIQPNGQMALVGDVVFETDSGSEYRIPTRVDFPPDYPAREPAAYEVGNLFPHVPDRHFYSDSGRCCLWLDVESPWRPKDPEGLRRFLEQLTVYYHRQVLLSCGAASTWPGPERGHGGFGYLGYLKETWAMGDADVRRMRPALGGRLSRNARCPCGSGKRYRRCHQPQVTRFLQRAHPETVRQLLAILEQTKNERAALAGYSV